MFPCLVAVEVTPHSCETHEAPGACTIECARMVDLMMGEGYSQPYDPTGCSYRPEPPMSVHVLTPAAGLRTVWVEEQ